MKLYILRRRDEIGWDEMQECLVRAEDTASARLLAAGCARDEGPAVWCNTRQVSCHPVSQEGPAKVLLKGMRNG